MLYIRQQGIGRFQMTVIANRNDSQYLFLNCRRRTLPSCWKVKLEMVFKSIEFQLVVAGFLPHSKQLCSKQFTSSSIETPSLSGEYWMLAPSFNVPTYKPADTYQLNAYGRHKNRKIISVRPQKSKLKAKPIHHQVSSSVLASFLSALLNGSQI